MATEFAVVRAQAQTAGGTQDITSSSITDASLVLGFMFGHTSDGGTPSTHARMCVGVCDIEDEAGASGIAEAASHAMSALNGRTTTTFNLTTNAGGIGSASNFLAMRDTDAVGGANLVAAARVIPRPISGIANGFRLSWTTTPDQAYEMVFVILGGLSNQALRVVASSTSTGFESDGGILLSTSGSYAAGDGSAANDAQANLGFFIRSGLAQKCAASEWNHAQGTTDCDSEARSANAAGEVTLGGTASSYHTVTAVGATTVSFTLGTASSIGIFFNIGDTAQVGVALETIPGSTGVASFTGLGFTPSVVAGIATGVNATDTRTDGASAASQGYFAFNLSGAEYAGAIRLEEGVALGSPSPASAASSLFKTKAVLLLDESGSVATEASSAAAVVGGFSLNFSSAAGGRMALIGFAPGALTSSTSETEQISEGVLVIVNRFVSLSDSVQISDNPSLFLLDVPVLQSTDGKIHGYGFQAGAKRGKGFQAGAETGSAF